MCSIESSAAARWSAKYSIEEGCDIICLQTKLTAEVWKLHDVFDLGAAISFNSSHTVGSEDKC